MTNAHVAGWWPTELQIAFTDGRLMPAKTVYVDPHLDLAIISYMPAQRRQPPPMPTLECKSVPSVGHPVGTFGHPRGLRFSGTRGIVSAVTTRPGTEMLQTDAPANSGNSGGPLISLKTGRVVGIVTTKSTGENVEGLVFAIPMPYACTILRLLQARRDPSPPGSSIQFAIEENEERGLLVARSLLPATALDLRVGDTVIKAKGRAVANPTQLYDALRASLDNVALTVRRDGKEVRVTGKWPPAPLITEREGFWLDGALIAPAEDALGGFSVDGPRLLVYHVDPASEAEAVDLREFDLIERVNGQPVRTLKELDQRVQKSAGSERGVELLLLRPTGEGPYLFEYHRRRLSGEDANPIEDGG
jgi:serine protease Do